MDRIRTAAAVLHYAEGTIGPVDFYPAGCGTCARAVDLVAVVDRTYPPDGQAMEGFREVVEEALQESTFNTRPAAEAVTYARAAQQCCDDGIDPNELPAEVGEWVSAACGCVWRESRPAGVVIDPSEPRACARHDASHPASVRPSPQGMAMVPVTYHHAEPNRS